MTLSGFEAAVAMERKEQSAMSFLALETLRVGDGVMAYGGEHSHVNKVIGLGLEEPIDEEMLKKIDEFYADHGARPRLEITSFASGESLRLLALAGYVLVEVGNVFVRSVDDFELSHIEVRHVDRNDEKAVHEAVRLSMSGFYPDETDVPESAMNVGLRSAAHDITDGFIAIADGMPVGAAFCSSSHGITLLYGASTRPEFRTQGVQRALIGARLACGKARGSHHAVVVSRPGHATERSVSKLGFQLAYVRMALMKRAAH